VRARYIRAVRPARRLVRTELVFPSSFLGRVGVLGALVVGGTVAIAMVALVSIFLFETFRRAG
jgi:hypothetical protein